MHLIIGNRDANKLRFINELPLNATDSLFNDAKDVHTTPYSRTSYVDFLQDQEDTPILRLKWILEKTMGAPTAFECRRRELQSICEWQVLSDEDVYLSFTESVQPGNLMWKYLSYGEFATVINDTVFMHGSLTPHSMKRVPKGNDGSMYDNIHDVNDWVHMLNAWKNEQLKEIAAFKPEWAAHAYCSTWAGAAMLEFCSGAASRYAQRTPVVGNMFDNTSSKIIAPMQDAPAAWLVNSGIVRAVFGHQPHGMVPTYMVNIKHRVETITVDTLYGNKDAYGDDGNRVRAHNPRGDACTEVYIQFDPARKISRVIIKGTDGFDNLYYSELDNCYSNNESWRSPFLPTNLALKYIGRRFEQGGKRYFVAANSIHTASDDIFHVVSKELGFQMHYETRTCKELEEIQEQGRFLDADRYLTSAGTSTKFCEEKEAKSLMQKRKTVGEHDNAFFERRIKKRHNSNCIEQASMVISNCFRKFI